ncbi:pro-pol protein, partial [Moniliophthora roreri MCA 2997]
IVLICEPFLKVENHPFQCLVTHLRPGYGKSLVKADAEKNCCVSAFEKAEKQFKTILKELVGKKAFVVDAWTSDNNLVYLAIVVCFITNDWEIAQILFDFTHLEGPHTGKNMAKLLEKHIVELGLADNITALAADNTSNNNILREELASMLIDAHRFTVYDPDNMTTHCLLHAIHLAVQAFLLEIKAAEEGDIDEDEIEVSSEWTEEMAEGVTVQDWGMTEKTDQKLLNEQDDNSVDVKAIVQKIQQISKLTHSTPQHSEEFKKTISIMNAVTDDKSRKLHLLNLILDVVTQWNSIYFIVKQTQDLCAAINELYFLKPNGKTNTQADPLSHIPTFQVTGAEDNEGQVVLCPERFMSVTAARMKGKELEGRICKGVEKEAEVLQTVEELKKGLQRLVNRLLEWEEDDRLVYYKGKLYIPADKQIDHVVSSCHKECPERVPYMFLMNSDTLPVYISRDNFMILDISPAYAVLFGFEDNTDQLQIQSLRHPNGTGIATTTQHDNI